MRKSKELKAKYSKTNLYKQNAKVFILSLKNVGKSNFVTGEDVFPERELPEKAVTIKNIKYSPLGSELKN